MADITLNPADHAVIDALEDGRNIAANIAEEKGYERQYISSRLKRLSEHGIVRNIGKGVYELTEETDE
jgi:predicted transcriptional regulator